jgi:hypothetical protein
VLSSTDPSGFSDKSDLPKRTAAQNGVMNNSPYDSPSNSGGLWDFMTGSNDWSAGYTDRNNNPSSGTSSGRTDGGVVWQQGHVTDSDGNEYDTPIKYDYVDSNGNRVQPPDGMRGLQNGSIGERNQGRDANFGDGGLDLAPYRGAPRAWPRGTSTSSSISATSPPALSPYATPIVAAAFGIDPIKAAVARSASRLVGFDALIYGLSEAIPDVAAMVARGSPVGAWFMIGFATGAVINDACGGNCFPNLGGDIYDMTHGGMPQWRPGYPQ